MPPTAFVAILILMNIFLSWSGNRSRAVATLFREWLPNVIQALKPWLSTADIDQGTRWSAEIAAHLQESSVGILCLTPENLSAPWLLFEAGALSKTLTKTYVCTYLIGLEPPDLEGPLAMFQATRATKDETKRLLHTINKALGDGAISTAQLDDTAEVWWPRFEERLQTAMAEPNERRTQRSERQLLEELVTLSRSQEAKFEEMRSTSALPPAARLAVLCGSFRAPEFGGSKEISRVIHLGSFSTHTLFEHGYPPDLISKYRFEWNGILPPPGVGWTYSKEELDYLLAGGRIMMMNDWPVLRYFPGDTLR